MMQTEKREVPAGVWDRCTKCGQMVYEQEVRANLLVCPLCGFHRRVDARTRIEQLVDPGSFEEFLADLVSTDPLNFQDRLPYRDRIKLLQQETGEREAVIVGKAFIRGRQVVLGVMNPLFIMASMGSVVGEKITRQFERALAHKRPAVLLSASGGARMQEGVLSLMQMAKTSAARSRLREARVPYISILLHPTTGGVAASIAMLGDVILAEPDALIGFAGPRVIEQTIRQQLPPGFQRSEFLLEHGMVDQVVPRLQLKASTERLLRWFTAPPASTVVPSEIEPNADVSDD